MNPYRRTPPPLTDMPGLLNSCWRAMGCTTIANQILTWPQGHSGNDSFRCHKQTSHAIYRCDDPITQPIMWLGYRGRPHTSEPREPPIATAEAVLPSGLSSSAKYHSHNMSEAHLGSPHISGTLDVVIGKSVDWRDRCQTQSQAMCVCGICRTPSHVNTPGVARTL